MDYSIILTTCPDNESATSLASKLVEENLAACVQLSAITSFYTWKSEVHTDPEIRLTIKTRSKLYHKVEKFILDHHPYEVPQIVQTPVVTGSAAYLEWMDENTLS